MFSGLIGYKIWQNILIKGCRTPPAAVGRVPCVQPILKSFLVCRWQARRFSHKKGEPAVETVKATTDSERRKSRCRYTYTDVCPRLQADAVRWNYVTCLTRPPAPVSTWAENSRSSTRRSCKQPSKELCVAVATANVSYTNIGKWLFEPDRKYLSTGEGGREGSAAIGSPQEKGDWISRGNIWHLREKQKKKSSTNLTTFLVHCHAHTRFMLSSYKQVFTIAGWEETCSQLSWKKSITRIKKQQNAGDDGGDSTFRVGSFRSPSIECELCLCMHDVFKDLCTFEKN